MNLSLSHNKTLLAPRLPVISREEKFPCSLESADTAKTLRVAHILRKFNADEWGGTETVIERLTDGLAQNDVESIVYCPRTEKTPEREPLEKNGCIVRRFHASVPILGISHERKRQMVSVGGNLVSFDLPLALWREPDLSLIHAHALGRLGSIGAAIARARRIPFVITVHGGLLDLPPAMKQNFDNPDHGGIEWGKIFGLFLHSRKMLERADAILTCNPNEARLLQTKYPTQRIRVQPHGIPVELYERDCRAEARVAFPQIRGRQMLLCVGRIDPVKNQKWLVEQAAEIFKRHSNALLMLVGAATDEAYENEIKQFIRQSSLDENILLAGGLPPGDARLIGLFQESRALVLTSVSETFGLVLLEAWAAGTTVISSRTSGASALVKHGENGWLFDLNKPPEFQTAVDVILNNPGLRNQFAVAGKEFAATQFNVSAIAAQVKKLYEELIEKKFGGASLPPSR